MRLNTNEPDEEIPVEEVLRRFLSDEATEEEVRFFLKLVMGRLFFGDPGESYRDGFFSALQMYVSHLEQVD